MTCKFAILVSDVDPSHAKNVKLASSLNVQFLMRKESSRRPATTKPKTHGRHSDGRLTTSLIARGLSVSSTLDKNDVLLEMQRLWEFENEFLQENLQKNREKEAQLKRLTEQLEKKKQDHRSTVTNTSFYPVYRNRWNKRDVDRMIYQAEDIEAQITNWDDVEDAELLSKIKASQDLDDVKRLQLMDLIAKRLETYIYSFRKKLVAIEESQFIAHEIKGKYRHVTDLVNTYHLVLAENEALKSQESSMASDAVIKRRNLKQCSDTAAGDLALILQKSLDENSALLEWFQDHHRSPKGKYIEKTFDEMVPDKKFAGVELFENEKYEILNDDDEVIETVQLKGTPEAQLKTLTMLKEKMEERLRDTEQQLEELRKVKHATTDRDFKTQLEKQWSLNDRMLAELQYNQEDIDKAILEHLEIFKQIRQTIEDHRFYTRRWKIAYSHLVDLFKSHCDLLPLQTNNASIVMLLLSISSAFALNDFSSTESEAIVRDFVTGIIKPLLPVMPSPSELDLDKPEKSKKEVNLFDIMAMRQRQQQRKRSPKRRRSPSSRRTPRASAASSHDIDTLGTSSEHHHPSPTFKPYESMTLISGAITNAGFLMGSEHDFHKETRAILDYSFTNIQQTAENQISDFGEEYLTNLHAINGFSYEILVRPHEDAEVQTEPPSYDDAETLAVPTTEVKRSRSRLKSRR